jgi:hypothetical protein
MFVGRRNIGPGTMVWTKVTGRTGPITLRADDGLLRIFRLGNWNVEVEHDSTTWPRLGNCLRQSVDFENGTFFFS